MHSRAFTDPNTRLLQHAHERADKVFIESPDQGTRVTFGEFETLTRRFASFLARSGACHGDRISILADNGIEALVVFWGALRAGVIVNPINVEIREQHVGYILERVAPKLVFHGEDKTPRVRGGSASTLSWRGSPGSRMRRSSRRRGGRTGR